jgi:hypothetical protein
MKCCVQVHIWLIDWLIDWLIRWLFNYVFSNIRIVYRWIFGRLGIQIYVNNGPGHCPRRLRAAIRNPGQGSRSADLGQNPGPPECEPGAATASPQRVTKSMRLTFSFRRGALPESAEPSSQLDPLEVLTVGHPAHWHREHGADVQYKRWTNH